MTTFIDRGDGNDPDVELTEYNAHDLLASAIQCLLSEVIPVDSVEREELVECAGCIGQIKIRPLDRDKFAPELVTKWERKLNELVQLLRSMDNEYHEDADYTC